MASIGWIAGTRDAAIKRIGAAVEKLSEHLDVAALVLPTDRDPAYERAVQLDAIATWLESVVEKFEPPAEDEAEDNLSESEPPAETPRKRGRPAKG